LKERFMARVFGGGKVTIPVVRLELVEVLRREDVEGWVERS